MPILLAVGLVFLLVAAVTAIGAIHHRQGVDLFASMREFEGVPTTIGADSFESYDRIAA